MLSPRHALMLVAAAAVIAWTIGRFRERESLTRHSVSLGLGVVFCAGFFLLHKWAEAIPANHRHWLLYVGIGASVLGPIAVAPGVAAWERILVAIVAAGTAASALVPIWESLTPARTILVPALTAYLALLALLVEPLASRVSPRATLISMLASSFVLAAVVAPIWNVTQGTLAAMPFFALLGVGLVTWFSPPIDAMRGTALAYAFVVGGGAFLSCVEPDPAVWILLAVPAAPLAMWLCVAGPLSRPLPRKLLCGGVLLTGLYLAAVAGWIVIVHGAPTEEY